MSIMSKKAADLTVGEQLKLSGVATVAVMAIYAVPFGALVAYNKVAEARRNRKNRKILNQQ